MKNGWENKFTESWQHLAPSAAKSQSASNGVSSQNTNHPPEFPLSAIWTSIQKAGDKVPPITIQNMMRTIRTATASGQGPRAWLVSVSLYQSQT